MRVIRKLRWMKEVLCRLGPLVLFYAWRGLLLVLLGVQLGVTICLCVLHLSGAGFLNDVVGITLCVF